MDTAVVHVTLAGIVSVGSLVGLLIVITGILGAAFRTSRNVQNISNYRDAAQSWEARANAQEREMADQQHQIDTCNIQIGHLRQEVAEKDRQLGMLQHQIDSMRDLLQGRAAFEELADRIGTVLNMGESNRAVIRETHDNVQRLLASSQAKGELA